MLAQFYETQNKSANHTFYEDQNSNFEWQQMLYRVQLYVSNYCLIAKRFCTDPQKDNTPFKHN